MKPAARPFQLHKLFLRMRSSLWFLPALVILALMILAVALVEADQRTGPALYRWWPRLFLTQAEGARAMLSTIASSMATVAGVVFSITLVALSLASSQYSSRVLRTFMRDRTTQLVLGVFVGVYLYCLLVLRTISSGPDAFVPALAVLGGLALAVLAVGIFILFIHHIAAAIQASEIAAAVTREALQAIDSLYPEQDAGTEERPTGTTLPQLSWQPIPAQQMGYLQSVDHEALLQLALHHATTLRMECAMGDFVGPGTPLMSVALTGPLEPDLIAAVNRAHALATYRTIEQDPAFGLRQLVDIALRALSSGVNDSTTAATCIEHLTVLLSRCASRCLSAPSCFAQGEWRVLAKGPDFDDLLALGFLQILENAEGNTEILCRLLEALARIAGFTRSPARLAALQRWQEDIAVLAKNSLHARQALAQMESRLRHTASVLEGATQAAEESSGKA